MDLDNILGLSGGGLEPGNSPEVQEELEKRLQKEHDLSMMFKLTFESEAGKAALKHLHKRTINTVTWNFNMPAADATINGYAREGQNSIYRYIVEMIEKADTLKKQIDEGK